MGIVITYGALALFFAVVITILQRSWGAAYDLKTQPDLMALRFDSRAIRIIAALIGVAGLFPWMVLGMQSLGAVFHALSLGHLGFTVSVMLGVAVMALRQVWTIRMGM